MQLLEPLTELRDRLRGCPPWVLVLTAPLYPLVFLGCLLCLPLFLPRWLLGSLLRPLPARIARSRLVRWLSAKRVEDCLADLMALARPSGWNVTQADDLLGRIRRLRRVLLVFIVGQWAMLVLVGLLLGLSLLCSLPDVIYLAVPCVAALLLAAILSVLGLRYYRRLYQYWRGFDMPTCGRCGYIRKDSPNSRCPECGAVEPPVRPGRFPACDELWKPLINEAAAGGAFYLLCAAFLFDRLILYEFLTPRLHGWVVLLMTACLSALLLQALWFFRSRWRTLYLRRREDG